MKRRDFLKQSTFASGMFFVPQFLKAFENNPMIKPFSHKKVVIIQLKGGNDGLNTVVPFNNDIYYQQRNNIAIKQNNLFKISDEVGLHKSLQPLQKFHDKGFLSIINNVGYPNPNLSHFRSTDIWQTASDSNEYLQNGWVGRYLDYTKGNPYNAIEINFWRVTCPSFSRRATPSRRSTCMEPTASITWCTDLHASGRV